VGARRTSRLGLPALARRSARPARQGKRFCARRRLRI